MTANSPEEFINKFIHDCVYQNKKEYPEKYKASYLKEFLENCTEEFLGHYTTKEYLENHLRSVLSMNGYIPIWRDIKTLSKAIDDFLSVRGEMYSLNTLEREIAKRWRIDPKKYSHMYLLNELIKIRNGDSKADDEYCNNFGFSYYTLF